MVPVLRRLLLFFPCVVETKTELPRRILYQHNFLRMMNKILQCPQRQSYLAFWFWLECHWEWILTVMTQISMPLNVHIGLKMMNVQKAQGSWKDIAKNPAICVQVRSKCILFKMFTLRCLIYGQVLINVRDGKFWKTNKRTGPNKSTGWKKVMNIPLIYCNFCEKRAIFFVWVIIDSNSINVRSLIS